MPRAGQRTKGKVEGRGQCQSRTLYQNDYTYDNAGQRLTNLISDQNGPVRTETYGYDEINRLTAVNYGDGNTQSYAFDNMGNRLTKVNNGTPEAYTYNNANMLLTRGANAYTNDANGNTLTGGGRTNTWDSQNRLVQCSYNGTTTTNTYACDGLRHRSVVGANTTDYVLDSSMFVRELLNGTVKATYLVGPRGPEYRRDDQAGTIRWYVYDGLGSVVGEVAPDGALTRSQSFDVYGCVRTSSGTATTKHKFVGSLGHPSDDETGLIYTRARHYDPVCGRFVSEDPGRDGANWFRYCHDNPVCAADPDGKSEMTEYLSSVACSGLLMGTVNAAQGAIYRLMTTGRFTWGDALSMLKDFAVGFLVGVLCAEFASLCEAGTWARRAFEALACLISPIDIVKSLAVAAGAGAVGGYLRGALDAPVGRQIQVGVLIAEMERE